MTTPTQDKLARAMFASDEALPEDTWMDDGLTQYGDAPDLFATVDGEVNFSALARVALSCFGRKP